MKPVLIQSEFLFADTICQQGSRTMTPVKRGVGTGLK